MVILGVDSMIDGYNIVVMDDNTEGLYRDFIDRQKNILVYYSVEYKKVLDDTLSGSISKYFICLFGDKIIAVLPSFESPNSDLGSVLNSLPFYGSNGGIVIDDSLGQEDKIKVFTFMLSMIEKYCQEHNIAACTFIGNPLEPKISDWYKQYFNYDFEDFRTGQFTCLMPIQGNIDHNDYEAQILAKCHQKTRNLVRKGLKEKFHISIENNQSAMNSLYSIHVENMQQIGGIAKPEKFFNCVVRQLEGGQQYDILIAKKEGEIAAALLLLYFGNTVEYFTPVINQKFRSSQPMSALIFDAMLRATKKGYKKWNWGGTWESQGGVYHFKTRWGAKDLKYTYFTKVYNRDITNLSKEQILQSYPFYYVLPFCELTD
jgi:hypothetical protein